jgi:hypothetical protein
MAEIENGKNGIILGDPVPWFGAPLIGEGAFNLQVAAGRWIVLSFLGSPADPKVREELAELIRDAHLFDENRILRRAHSAARRSGALHRAQHTGSLVYRRL